jgi:hypothetical protein
MQIKIDLSMGIGQVPTFKEVMAELDDVPALLYECIEAGSLRGREVAREERFENDPLDPWLVATVLRGRVRRMLKKRGVDATVEGPLDISAQPLIGLLFHFKGYSFRILKAVDGKAPGYAQSIPRKNFYDQVPTKYRSPDGKLCISKLNLLVLYTEDESGASNLILACPSIGARFAHEVAYHWIERLPHPGESTAADVPLTPGPTAPDPLSEIVQPLSEPVRGKKKA